MTMISILQLNSSLTAKQCCAAYGLSRDQVISTRERFEKKLQQQCAAMEPQHTYQGSNLRNSGDDILRCCHIKANVLG